MKLTDDSVAAELPVVRVICGPTAAGKSSIAFWLASRRPIAIISADSRQVYRGFDIGTAKPTPAEQSLVTHYGIDVVEATSRYSAAAWADAANGWITQALADGQVPVVVGGTGLYLRALFEGLFVEPSLDPVARADVARVLGELSLEELRRWAEVIDPSRAHLGRAQLLRSIEIALLTGRRLSDLHRQHAREPRWRPRYLLVDAGPALGDRIAARIDHMLNHGWPDEVRRLTQTVPENAPAWNATGYGVIQQLIGGAISREQARSAVLVATRQYAKRQRTWFRHQLPAPLVAHVNSTDVNWPAAVSAWYDAEAVA